jgi:hypothetical protein
VAWRIAAVLALLVFTASYRFNTLGGALGGFDDDHFVHFVYAKQVEAGEQPLRDFDGLGLQGARPSLTYEASAAAQRLLGDTFRSEALLTVGALAVAAAITFWTAAVSASPAPAFVATLMTVLLAPKLYNYPKVLLLALAAAGAVWYARRQSRDVVVALAVLTAVAFLFRHDYAVYVGLSTVLVLAFASGGIRRAASRIVLYGALSVVLLLPSLLYVQSHGGLGAYLADGLEQSRNEAGRTELQWPRFTWAAGDGESGLLASEDNAVAWLYYLHLLLPVLVLAALARRPAGPVDRDVRKALFAIALATLVINPLLLRGNVGARLGDVGPLTAVLFAALANRVLRGGGHVARIAGALAIAAIAVPTVRAVWTVGSVRSELDTSGWSDSIGKITAQAGRRWTELGALPAAYWSGEPSGASLRAAQYLNQCTTPDDRIVVMAYQPELLALADRRFGAGRAAVLPDLLSEDEHERVMLQRWRQQQVPLVLTEPGDDYASDYRDQFAVLDGYLQSEYEPAGTLPIDGGELRVLRRRTRAAVRQFGDEGLPCFR